LQFRLITHLIAKKKVYGLFATQKTYWRGEISYFYFHQTSTGLFLNMLLSHLFKRSFCFPLPVFLPIYLSLSQVYLFAITFIAFFSFHHCRSNNFSRYKRGNSSKQDCQSNDFFQWKERVCSLHKIESFKCRQFENIIYILKRVLSL